MNFIKRLSFILIMPVLMVLFLIQSFIGIALWVFAGYDFMDKQDPIFITVFNKLFDE